MTWRNCAAVIVVGQRLARQSRTSAFGIDRGIGEERPLHQIDEVRADVGQRFALLLDVEEPGGPQVGHARHQLQDVVDALHVDGRLCSVPGRIAPKMPGSLTNSRCRIEVIS